MYRLRSRTRPRGWKRSTFYTSIGLPDSIWISASFPFWMSISWLNRDKASEVSQARPYILIQASGDLIVVFVRLPSPALRLCSNEEFFLSIAFAPHVSTSFPKIRSRTYTLLNPRPLYVTITWLLQNECTKPSILEERATPGLTRTRKSIFIKNRHPLYFIWLTCGNPSPTNWSGLSTCIGVGKAKLKNESWNAPLPLQEM